MSNQNIRLLVTGASGQLGRLVVERLLETVPPANIAAIVRTESAGAALADRGVQVHVADYDKPETLDAALAGAHRVLLISSNALGRRVAQHRNVIEAAKRAGVGLLAYTSVLRAGTSPLGVADEHRQTEALLQASGVPFVVLRNGWYTENYTASISAALAHHTLLGGAGEGRIASAARADYAAAAAAVLTTDADWSGRILELAGDQAYTLAELAEEIAKQAGQPVAFKNLPKEDYEAALLGAGLPPPVAELIAESDECAVSGALFDDGHQLSTIIGRPTTPMPASVEQALRSR